MNKFRCFQPINFDGAEFDSFRYQGSFLILKIILWDGEECELVFKNPLFFSSEMSFFGFRPYEVMDRTLLKEYILDIDAEKMEKCKIFCFQDLNENPAIIVVAESGEPTKLLMDHGEGKAWHPRHHGPHVHVETKINPAISGDYKNNIYVHKPPGYTRGPTGFIPGENLPNLTIPKQ